MACCFLGAMLIAQWLASWERARNAFLRLLGRGVAPAQLNAKGFGPINLKPWLGRLIAMELLALSWVLAAEGETLMAHARHHFPMATQAITQTFVLQPAQAGTPGHDDAICKSSQMAS